MRLGILISLLIVVVFGAVAFVGIRGVAESPTPATSPDKLQRQTLGKGLPALFEVTDPAEDASAAYEGILGFYKEHQARLSTEPPDIELTDQLVTLMIRAMKKGRVTQGFLDKHLPVFPGATPTFDDALETIPRAVMWMADDLYQSGRPERAKQALRSVLALGLRAFDDNTRLYIRWQGLDILITALHLQTDWLDDDPILSDQTVGAWDKATTKIDRVWMHKYELMARTQPHIGDLLNIANNDQDITFRVAGMLKLGMAKFNAGTRGNARAIHETIERATNDPFEIIAKAAIAARALTRDQYHKIY